MNKPRISIIAAMSEERGIGNRNELLFKIPEDFKRMRKKTTGHPLIMGRRTFESLGRLLPNRTHIVITHDPDRLKHLSYKPDAIVSSIKKGILKASQFPGADEIFIFGGGQVFDEALRQGVVTDMYLTIVKGKYPYDTFFPDYTKYDFRVVNKEEHKADGYTFTFLDLEK